VKRRKVSDAESEEQIIFTPEVKSKHQSNNKRICKQSSKKIKVTLTSEKKSTLKLEEQQHITPQKKNNLNAKAGQTNSVNNQTYLKTMDTMKHSSNIIDNQQFNIEMTPNSLSNIEYHKFNSNTKEGCNMQSSLIDQK